MGTGQKREQIQQREQRGNRSGTEVVLAGLLTLVLGACSTAGGKYGDMDESLDIEILPNASKLFTYRVERDTVDPARVQIQRPRPSRERTRERRQSEEIPGRRVYRYLQNRTEQALELTGYCTEGYIELDRRLANHVLWLRGECREGASEADRARFGQKDTLAISRPE